MSTFTRYFNLTITFRTAFLTCKSVAQLRVLATVEVLRVSCYKNKEWLVGVGPKMRLAHRDHSLGPCLGCLLWLILTLMNLPLIVSLFPLLLPPLPLFFVSLMKSKRRTLGLLICVRSLFIWILAFYVYSLYVVDVLCVLSSLIFVIIFSGISDLVRINFVRVRVVSNV